MKGICLYHAFTGINRALLVSSLIILQVGREQVYTARVRFKWGALLTQILQYHCTKFLLYDAFVYSHWKYKGVFTTPQLFQKEWFHNQKVWRVTQQRLESSVMVLCVQLAGFGKNWNNISTTITYSSCYAADDLIFCSEGKKLLKVVLSPQLATFFVVLILLWINY